MNNVNATGLTPNHKAFLYKFLSSETLTIPAPLIDIVVEIKQILRQEVEAAQAQNGGK